MTNSPETVPAVSLLLRYLEQEGVRHIFGIPGGPIIPLYEAMHARGVIRPVLAKHEAGAVFMADAYARVTGGIGVAATTIGPGATNAATGMAVAYADRIPVLLLTPQTPTHQFGRGAFQESSPQGVDIVELMRPVTKWSAMIPHPDRTAAFVRQALRLMTSGRPGPVHLNIPCDFATRRVLDELLAAGSFRCRSRSFDRSAVEDAARLLLAARRPAILAGHGVNLSRAWPALRALAESFSIPVATTFKAKGAFPEDHPLSLGVLSNSCDPRVAEFLLDPATDVLLVAGSSLGEVSSAGWDVRLAGKKALLQADIDPAELGRNFPVDVALPGDAGATLTELRFAMLRRRPGFSGGVDVRPSRAQEPVQAADGGESPMKPQALLRELRAVLPRDGILFVDNGTMRTWAGRHFPVYQEGCFFVNMGLASMGYATAGCVGAALAAPDRSVVALVGDAAFAMNGMEVHTAAEYGVPVVWVVANNGGHGMVYHGERRLYGDRFHTGVFRKRLDAAGLAAESFRAGTARELGRAVREALTRRAPCVIDADVDLHEAPPSSARDEALKKELVGAGPVVHL